MDVFQAQNVVLGSGQTRENRTRHMTTFNTGRNLLTLDVALQMAVHVLALFGWSLSVLFFFDVVKVWVESYLALFDALLFLASLLYVQWLKSYSVHKKHVEEYLRGLYEMRVVYRLMKDGKGPSRRTALVDLRFFVEKWIDLFRVVDSTVPYDEQLLSVSVRAERAKEWLAGSSVLLPAGMKTAFERVLSTVIERSKSVASKTTLGIISDVQYRWFVVLYFVVLLPFHIMLRVDDLLVSGIISTIVLSILGSVAIFWQVIGDPFDPNAHDAHVYSCNVVKEHREFLDQIDRLLESMPAREGFPLNPHNRE